MEEVKESEEILMAQIERLRLGRDMWKSVADELYKHVCTDWCWHCGAERTRNIYASNAVDMYREAVESEC